MVYLVSNQTSLWESTNYQVISVEMSLELLEPLREVGTDTETEGFDPYTKRLLSLQLGCFDFQVVIDCTTVDVLLYKDYLESDRLFLFWNAKFDLKFLYHAGIVPNCIYDGFLAEKLQWLGYPPGMHEMSLKAAGINYLGIDLDKSIRGKIVKTGLTEDVIVYAAYDTKYLPAIKEKQLELIEEKELGKALDFENEFVKCLAYIEYCGAKLDIQKWKAKMEKDLVRLEKAEADLNNWIETNMPNSIYCKVNLQGDLFSGFDTKPRCRINWSSSRQVIPLFEELGFNLKVLDKKTKKSKKSVEAKVIKPQKDKSPIAPLFIEYKEAAIVVNTFGQKFLNNINPVTGRIHANFNQLGTDTTRLSSTEPNLQNLPKDKETRACFVADKGNVWISADYSGQESYLMASIANDEAMLDELINGSGDLHTLTARMVFEEIPDDMPLDEAKDKFPKLRQEAKGYEFCFNYGGQDSTLIRNYGLSAARAKEIYHKYMSGFSGLRDYQAFRRWDVMQKGYILLSPITKHKAYIYDFEELCRLQSIQNTEGFWEYYREMKKAAPDCDTVANVRKLSRRRADSEKQSINYPIQAAGALCFKLASIKLFRWLKANNLLFKVKYCIPVHDELNLEAPAEIGQEIADILVKCMEAGGKPFCKRAHLGATVDINDHWVH